MSDICIGNSTVGRNQKVCIVAELSGNHAGSIDNAIKIIHSAKRAGVNAIKLQTYTADSITLNSNSEDFLISKDSPWSIYKNLWNLYDKAHTPWSWHPILFDEAKKVGLDIFSSPFDETAVDFLENLGVSVYKIASPEINPIRLIEKVAKTGKPIILSSGVAEKSDIELAINTIRKIGTNEIILLKCTSAYPTPEDEANLSTITDMKESFGLDIGFSDHTEGDTAAIIATSLGAVMIEKHFIGDLGIESVDSFFSLNEIEMKSMIEKVRLTERLIGSPFYGLTQSSKPSSTGRRSIYISSEIHEGEIFTKENIKVVRPSFGLDPKFYNEILGKKASRSIKAGARLSWDMVSKES